eukprot:TRINITY_DN7305_c0_g1_i1.p2 TRINITY_DN7305_c0_g1~~TRINITY_DN7305_c0_g1_i1.p2  ORF type:complete len:217 (-),score=62.02 TRINITY_DN7305_c0_g1_i1:2927-3577(-)
MFKAKFTETEASIKSLNYTVRKKENDRIERENMALARRLLNKPAAINVKSLEREFLEHVKHKTMLQKVKKQIKKSASTAVLPPLKKAELEATKTEPIPESKKEIKEIPESKEEINEIPENKEEVKKTTEEPPKGGNLFITGEDLLEDMEEVKKDPEVEKAAVEDKKEQVEANAKIEVKEEEKKEKSETQNILSAINENDKQHALTRRLHKCMHAQQ